MSGHGHVTPNADGSKARCGGPGICVDCSLEQSRKASRGVGARTRRITVELTETDLRRSAGAPDYAVVQVTNEIDHGPNGITPATVTVCWTEEVP